MIFAFAVSYFALAGDLKRRQINIDPYNVVLYVAIAGILGAKLWHVFDTPDDRLTGQILSHPREMLSWFRSGFAWFGGFVAGIGMLLFLAHRNKINLLRMLDIASPAAAIGYAVGRIGCLVSGDGDYGKPTNWSWPWGMAFPHGQVPTTQTCPQAVDAAHPSGWPANCNVYPTPIYEFLAGVVIFWYIWRRGRSGNALPPGLLTGEFLLLSGAERFLVEFIRINPRVIFGMSNAQFTALLSMIAGAVLMVWASRGSAKTAVVAEQT
jgi:phosphatidylglycerol:prolipoprotein diacylglycerol transferase